jgi:peptidyl-prolyl cis-trans isomerase SurA
MKKMKCFCIFAASAFFAAACAAQPNGFLDGILAVVNNSVITYLQVEDAIALQIDALRRAYPNDPTNFYAKVKQFQQEQLELTERAKLVLDDFARGEYTTNWVDDLVEAAIKQDIKEAYEGRRDKLIRTLQAEGRTYESYKKLLREHIIVGELVKLHSSGKIIVSPAAIEKFYNDHPTNFFVEDQVKLRMIQIPQPSGSPPGTAKQIAGEILQRIDGGVPFAEMAAVYSSGPGRAAGGDCGWVDRTTYRKELTDAAFSLKPGQRGPVVELPDERAGAATGATICYLLMVEDFHPAHVRPLSEVQGEIEHDLENQRGKLLEDQWIERLRAKSHVEIF